MTERPLQVGDRVKMGPTVGPVVATDDQGFTIDWPDIHRRAYAWHNADEFTVVSRAAVLATLDDGVEVRRGRHVPEGWEWRFHEKETWKRKGAYRPLDERCIVECRPKPSEPVMVELSVEDAEWLTNELLGDASDEAERIIQALERRGRDDG